MRILYIIYQYCIAFPLLLLLTLFTAVFTVVCCPWRNSEFVHAVQAFWSRSFCYLLFIPVTMDGAENIQKGQSYVFVSNHESMYDVFVIYGWLPVIFKWLMKAELRKVPFVGIACKAAGHIFVDRTHAKASAKSLAEVEKQLKDGVCTVIFPEGTRSRDGQLGRFKRGALQIALDLSLPIVPISLEGCYEVMSRNSKTVHRHPIHIHIGKPIFPEALPKQDPTAAVDLIRQAVADGMETSPTPPREGTRQ